MKGEGGGGGGEEERRSFLLSPPLPRNLFFFALVPTFSTNSAETLATQASDANARSRRSYGKIEDCEPSTTTTTT